MGKCKRKWKKLSKKKSVLVDDENYCMVCGLPNPERHHVFHGTANRKIADRYRYFVPLCGGHHRGNTGVHQNKDFDLYLKKLAQKHFEANNGDRNDFIAIFGKSYL